jgi:hypothetical protein
MALSDTVIKPRGPEASAVREVTGHWWLWLVAGGRRLVRPQRLERPRRAGRRCPAQHLRAGRQGQEFANSIGCDVVTADAVPDWTAMHGRARVDGELWCDGTTARPQHSLGAMLA